MSLLARMRRPRDPKSRLRKELAGATLPSFPGVAMQALARLRDPKASLREVGELLASDPGLSVALLRLANGAGRGALREIGSVRHAVAMLGRSEVESLVLTVGVRDALPQVPARGFDPPRFWTTAARRAATARAFAERLDPARAQEHFTAGLLQDMALPVLSGWNPRKYGRLLEAWHGGDADLAAMERETWGWCHGEVATWLCTDWGLPESLASAIGGHHHDDDCPVGVRLVSVLREGERDGADELVAMAEDRFGLEPDEAVAVLEEGARDGAALAPLFVR